MTDTGDAGTAAVPPATASAVAADAAPGVLPYSPDERAARRAALRDLAAMIGVEVFY